MKLKMKTLPKLYKNESVICKNNNESHCLVVQNNKVIEEINSIFNSYGFPFDKKVLIKTNNNVYKTYLVTKNNDKITTLNDEEILIKDIISIERI